MQIRALALAFFVVSSLPISAYSAPFIAFIGETSFPTGYSFNNTEVGGLSGIDYDPESGRYIAISDDRAERGFTRFYELSIDLSDGYLHDGDIRFTRVTEILDQDGTSFSSNTVDPESIRLAPFPNTLYWTSEGNTQQGIAPFVRVMTRDGKHLEEFDLPVRFTPTDNSGVRNNLALESLTFSTNQQQLYTATENALIQDGEEANLNSGSPVRVLQLNRSNGKPSREHIYITDPVVAAPIPANAFSTNGLVELLAIAPNTFIALERAFSVGVGNSVRLYLTTTKGASNLRRRHSINGLRIRPMKKQLLLEVSSLGIQPDNIEGITFGPRLANGNRSLILVSDNNFNPSGQETQFLAFELKL